MQTINPDEVDYFVKWMEQKGFLQVPLKGEWEALRFQRYDEHVIYYKRKGKVMIYCPEGQATFLFQQCAKEILTQRSA